MVRLLINSKYVFYKEHGKSLLFDILIGAGLLFYILIST